ARVDRRGEEIGRQRDVAGSARFALDDLDAHPFRGLLDDGQLVAVLRDRLQALREIAQALGLRLDEAMLDHKVRRRRAEVGAQARGPTLELVQRPREAVVASLGQLVGLAAAVLDVDVLDALANEQVLELRLLLDVLLTAADLDAVKRLHGDVHVAALDELLHLPVEERQDQGPDVRSVHICVGHDDDPVVAQLLEIELIADVRADRGDDRLDLRIREDFVDPVLLGVDHLAAQGQDRLKGAVPGVDGGAAGRVALDEVELGGRWIVDRAVRELARERHAVERALTAGQLARLAGRLARIPRRDRLVDDLLRLGRVFLEELGQLDVDGLLDEATHPWVAELRLRLPLELRLAQLHGKDGCEPFAHILALEVLLLLLEQAVLARVVVQRPRQRRLEA